MFQPHFLKQAKLLHKGVTRFLDYKRDLLPKAKLDEITGLRTELEEAMKARNSTRLDELAKTINQTCERAMPDNQLGWLAEHLFFLPFFMLVYLGLRILPMTSSLKPVPLGLISLVAAVAIDQYVRHRGGFRAAISALSENIEVFFVSIVIALGIRAYIAQPFQIPTGSMQPTLNGIRVERTEEDPNPGLLGKALGFFTGTTYLNAVSDYDGYLTTPIYEIENGRRAERNPTLTEHHILIFRPYTHVHFEDGHTITINCPMRQLTEELGFDASAHRHIRQGDLLARGLVHNGDHVIVNKFAYHFRRPERGEVFVFTTKNISNIETRGDFDINWGSQHYIKRLVGVPGNTIEVQSPELLIDGKKATEPGIRRVIDQRQSLSVPYAYHGYSPHQEPQFPMPVTLAKGDDEEYFAMGDNSYSSSDSRYWGPVPEQNVVGPGLFCYWPLTHHWGVIH